MNARTLRNVFLLAGIFATQASLAQDAVQVDPQHYRVELENDRVRVLRAKLDPHERTRSILIRPGVFVALTDQNLKLRRQDPPGEGEWHEKAGFIRATEGGFVVSTENIGDKPREAVLVELKGAAPARGGPRPGEGDSVRAAPDHYQTAVENERVRVVRMRYGPHEKSAPHKHPLPAVVVLLTDFHARISSPAGRTVERHAKRGEIIWRAAAPTHVSENLSDQPLEAVAIELKLAP